MTDAYASLAERLGYAKSPHLRRILEHLMTPRQAALVAELPKTPEELSQKFSLDAETVREELDILFRRGVIIPRNFQTLEGARFVRYVTQLHDSSMSPLRFDAKHNSTLFRLWHEFGEAEYDRNNAEQFSKMEQPLLRIVPAYKAIPKDIQPLPFEDVRELVKASGPWAVVACTCRQCKESVGQPCKRSHKGVCVQLGRGAEYSLARGSGTSLSLRQALEIIDEVEEDGLVHQWINNDSMSFTVLCNCCDCCCLNITALLKYDVPPTKLYAQSRFAARVEREECTACEECVTRCPFRAISMREYGPGEFGAVVDQQKCMGCGACVTGCRFDAIKFDLVRPKEHIPSAPKR